MSILVLQDTVDSVKESLNRDDVFDESIPRYVRRAILELERDYNFEYMKRTSTVVVPAGTDPPVFTFPDTPVKKIRFIRYTTTDGRLIYLERSDNEDQDQDETLPRPLGYWLNGTVEGQLTDVPSESLTLEIGTYIYTAPALDIENLQSQHDLFDVAEDLLANLTILKMSHLDDAAELFAQAKVNYDREIATFLRAQEDLDNSGRVNYSNYAKVLRRR